MEKNCNYGSHKVRKTKIQNLFCFISKKEATQYFRKMASKKVGSKSEVLIIKDGPVDYSSMLYAPADTAHSDDADAQLLSIPHSEKPKCVAPYRINLFFEEGSVTMGRFPKVKSKYGRSVQILGSDLNLSRTHAKIRFVNTRQRWMLTDLGSRQGLYVNLDRIMPRKRYMLTHGDRIDFCDPRLGPSSATYVFISNSFTKASKRLKVEEKDTYNSMSDNANEKPLGTHEENNVFKSSSSVVRNRKQKVRVAAQQIEQRQRMSRKIVHGLLREALVGDDDARACTSSSSESGSSSDLSVDKDVIQGEESGVHHSWSFWPFTNRS